MTAEYRRFCRALSAAMRQRHATMRDIEVQTGIAIDISPKIEIWSTTISATLDAHATS